MEWGTIFEAAKQWTLAAGEILKRATTESYLVEYKTSAADLVTEKDKEIEQLFIDKIKEFYPEHYFLGEEGLAKDQVYEYSKEIVWVVDPIDGTTNFVHQKRNFAISVGIYEHGKPRIGIVYDPISNELFHAIHEKGAYLNGAPLPKLSDRKLEEAIISLNQFWLIPNEKVEYKSFEPIIQKARGTRYIGSAALEIAYVACGRLDSYLDFRLSPWDIAGGMVILEEVGGVTMDLNNQAVNAFTPGITVFSNTSVYREMLKEIKNR